MFILVFLVFLVFLVLLIVVFVAVFSPAILLLMFLIMRRVDIIVPTVLNEIDRSTASIIFGAVLLPVFCVAGWHVQINWLFNNVRRARLNYDWTWVNEFWPRGASNVDLTIKARLPYAD